MEKSLIQIPNDITEWEKEHQDGEPFYLDRFAFVYLTKPLIDRMKGQAEMLKDIDPDMSECQYKMSSGKIFKGQVRTVGWIDLDESLAKKRPILVACGECVPLNSVRTHLRCFEVTPPYRNHGLSKQIMEVFIERFGVNSLWCYAWNMVAVSLYESFGFVHVKMEDGYRKMIRYKKRREYNDD